MEVTRTEMEKKLGVQGLMSWRYKSGVITIKTVKLNDCKVNGEGSSVLIINNQNP